MSATLEKYGNPLIRYRALFTLVLLLIIHGVGVFGLQSARADEFLAATPVILLISAGALLWNHREWNLHFVIIMLASLLTGFFVEVAGVATGAVFGTYWYGATLGPKLFDVPVMISVNWLILVYATGAIVAPAKWPNVVKALVSAALMTGLDVLIEPIAMRFDFWDWPGGVVPLQNYIAWFVISFVLLYLFHSLRFNKKNPLGLAVYAIQVLFFGSLNLIN